MHGHHISVDQKQKQIFDECRYWCFQRYSRCVQRQYLRRPLQTEYEGERDELHCYRIEGKSSIPFKLNKDVHYMIGFISKNRHGASDIQIVSEADFSINKYEDKGYCRVVQDY